MMRRFLVFLLTLSLHLTMTLPSFAQDGVGRVQDRSGQDRSGAERRNRQTMPEREPNTDDPDLPGFYLPRIDKNEYLRRRGAMIKVLRGLNDVDGLKIRNPRARAIEEMEFQFKQRANQTGDEQLLVNSAAALAGTWTEIGPAPIPNGQTTTVSTPVSGRTKAISIHPTNPDVVYVGTAQGGLYRSLNGGGSWTQLMDSAQSLAIGAVAISPSNPTTVWVGTGEASFSCDAFFGVGLYRIDNAESATPTLSGPFNFDASSNDVFSNRAISKILVHPTDPNTVFVTTASGIGGIGCDAPVTAPLRGVYRSTNAQGVSPTFTRLAIGGVPDISHTDMVFDPSNPNIMLVAVRGLSTENGGIYRTVDALSANPTFTRTLALGTSTVRIRATFGIARIGSVTTVYLATGEAGTGTCSFLGQSGQLRRSTDGGVSWSGTLGGGTNGFCGGQCSYDIAVAVNPTNTNQVLLGGSANSTCSSVLKRSTNGTSFSASNVGLHADTHAIVYAPSNPSVVYTGSDGGIWRSDDGGANWTSLNKAGYNATQFQSIAVHPIDPFFTIGGTQDNGTQWLRPDGSWIRADFGDGGFALIDQTATDTTNVTMYHTYYNAVGTLIGFGRVTNTANAQDNGWSFLGCGSGTANGISCSDSAVQFYAPMTLGPGNPNTLYFGTDRLYRSINRGTNMTVVSQQFTSGVATSALGVSPQNDNVRIVGLENGKVYRTMTGATSLTDVTGPIPAKYVARSVIDPNNQNTAYVTLAGFGLAAGQHVWKTTNINAATPTWAAAGSGIPDVPVNAFVVDPSDSNNLFAGTDIGVYNSSDGGATWTPYGTGLPVVAVFDMAIQNPSRTLRIATHGRGMWEISIGTPPPPTPPADPSGLTATAVSSSQINLSWTDNSNNESGFKIERCQGAGCTNFGEITQVGAGVTTFNNTGLTASTTYVYRVRAFNAGGDSGYSNTASATTPAAASIPNAPSNLRTTLIRNRRIDLAWNDNSNNETRFELERKTGSGSYSNIANPAANATTYSNTGLARRTTYTYRIRACNASGCSAYSNEVTATTN